MRISLKWLNDYVPVSASPAELGNLLTMSGNEMKALEVIGANWDKVLVGQVLAIGRHPNADRLRLVTVDLGADRPTVVCGASNFNQGDKIAFAQVGAELKDGHSGQLSVLKAAIIRGVESAGMICSEFELGISVENSGILVLPPDAPVGMSLKEYMGDSIIDLDVTPNRPDCLSVIGVAREVAALTGRQVKLPEAGYAEAGEPIAEKIAIEIQAADLCPRYSASLVTGISIKPSPRWMQERLIAAGMRPINNVVDISNFVMLEFGQPLHTFDYDRLQGRRIVVRRAVNGENIVSLDGVERKLGPDMLVIADADRAVAVAGVMGGANSEVTEATQNILIEAASFKATSIHRTGEALGLPSEARYRFERGIAAGLTLPALKRATQLISELGSGKAAKGILDVYPGRQPARAISLSLKKLNSLLGLEFGREQVDHILTSLGMVCEAGTGPDQIVVTGPDWRSDINIQEDLIEEVARIAGYEKIPNTLLDEALPSINPDPFFSLRKTIRGVFAASGFSEVLNFSMVSLELLKKLSPEAQVPERPPVRIANPMTAEMEYLRTSFRANLLTAFASNRRYQDGSIRLVEIGKVYHGQTGGPPLESDIVCAVMGGLRYEKSWQDNALKLDYYDARGLAENLLGRLGLTPVFEHGQDAGLHSQQQADLAVQGTRIGALGQVHPRVLTAFEIEEPVYLLELDLRALLRLGESARTYRPLPRYPSVVRDLAWLVPVGVTHGEIEKSLSDFPLVEAVQLFDIYSGEQVQAGKKSMAYHITFRSPDHTLTDEEANRVQQAILKKLEEQFGAVIRL